MSSKLIRDHYDIWSTTYDNVENKTRDLEAAVCRRLLADISFTTAIELGAGTGKNTVWLAARADQLTAVDFSAEMQAIARQKITRSNVRFELADITRKWAFADGGADLITCSLILEHIEDLDHIFHEAASYLSVRGHFYVCELHPFRQYMGTKARLETEKGVELIHAFTHHISDFTTGASNAGLRLIRFDEWFDNDDRETVPRLASFMFAKS
jgi:ubiquinone/menaquinone biosynthesis C-methylase UbiE